MAMPPPAPQSTEEEVEDHDSTYSVEGDEDEGVYSMDEDDDDFGVEYFSADLLPTNPLIDHDSAQVATNIRAMFDSHKAFFTRDAIWSVAQSFDKARGQDHLDGTVSIPDLVGNIIEFRLAVEDTSWRENGRRTSKTELAITEPCLDYRTVEHLLWQLARSGLDPIRGYLPMMVVFPTERRNKLTKEMVPRWNISTHDQVQASFQAIRHKWHASEHCAQLGSILKQYSTTIPHAINKIVAFACSTMSDANEMGRSPFQHALVLYMRDFLLGLNQDKTHEIKCYAQDPIYQTVDKSVLAQAGISVLSDPRGFLEIDETSVVVSVSPNVPVRQIITDLTRPAIMIWDRVIPATGRPTTDPVSSRVLDMVQREYLELEFPPDLDNFGHLGIYIRKK